MREIKFRGKRINNNNWAEGSLLISKQEGNLEPLHYFISQMNGGFYRIKPETIGQYTGLKDKNEKEIYEEDLLELINKYGEKVIAICRFGNRRLTTDVGTTIDIQCFYFEVEGWKTNPVVLNYKNLHDLEIMEVIGNIFENPELLVVD